MKRMAKHIIIAFFISCFVFILSFRNVFYESDIQLCDKLYQEEQLLDGTIMVLGIDERTLSEIGKFETWDRSIFADLLEILNSNPEARPALIGIDMMFFGKTDVVNDNLLAEAAGEYDNVVVGSSINFKTDFIEADGSFDVNYYGVELYEEPYPALKRNTKQGFLNTFPDGDGRIRDAMLEFTLPSGQVIPGFAYAMFEEYQKITGSNTRNLPPLDGNNQWYISYSSTAGGYNDGYSVVDVLQGTLPPEVFADAVVFIGPYATGMRDSYSTPIDYSQPMHGVEIHANMFQALLNQNYKTYAPDLLQCLIFAIVTFGAYFAFMFLSPLKSSLIMLIGTSAFVAGASYLGKHGLMIKIIYLPLALISLYVSWLVIHYIKNLLEKKKITDIFKKYVAPQIVDEIFKNSDKLSLGGQKREIASMFVDIRGFTPMSEMLSPEDVVEILNAYLDLTCKAIFKHNGTLDKFIGDATMAIFNAPIDMEDYIYKSVLTAWDIVAGGDELGVRLQKKYGRSVSFGIGIHCGPAVVGNIGNDVRMDYTAIGDTVNISARLESQARPGQVLLSQEVYEAVKDRITAVDLGVIELKGKANGVRVYGLAHINEYTQSAPLKTAGLTPGKGSISYKPE